MRDQKQNLRLEVYQWARDTAAEKRKHQRGPEYEDVPVSEMHSASRYYSWGFLAERQRLKFHA